MLSSMSKRRHTPFSLSWYDYALKMRGLYHSDAPWVGRKPACVRIIPFILGALVERLHGVLFPSCVSVPTQLISARAYTSHRETWYPGAQGT